MNLGHAPIGTLGDVAAGAVEAPAGELRRLAPGLGHLPRRAVAGGLAEHFAHHIGQRRAVAHRAGEGAAEPAQGFGHPGMEPAADRLAPRLDIGEGREFVPIQQRQHGRAFVGLAGAVAVAPQVFIDPNRRIGLQQGLALPFPRGALHRLDRVLGGTPARLGGTQIPVKRLEFVQQLGRLAGPGRVHFAGGHRLGDAITQTHEGAPVRKHRSSCSPNSMSASASSSAS